MNEQDFYEWMINHAHYTHNTSASYARAIRLISEHYSQNHEPVNLYNINDIEFLESIHRLYLLDGNYAEFGDIQHGTNRSALAALIRLKRRLNND